MISAIIMASGFSERMKQNKLLMDFKNKPILEHILETISECDFSEKILIGKDFEVLEIGRKYNFKVVQNYNSKIGQSESIRLGVKASRVENNFMFFVGDQPLLTKKTIDTIINCHKNNIDKIIVPTINARNANPTIFPNFFRNNLLNIPDDQSGKWIIQNNLDKVCFVQINDEMSFFDVDTPEDYNKINQNS